jgi:hypothetical protein
LGFCNQRQPDGPDESHIGLIIRCGRIVLQESGTFFGGGDAANSSAG